MFSKYLLCGLALLSFASSCTKSDYQELIEGKWSGRMPWFGGTYPCTLDITYLKKSKQFDAEFVLFLHDNLKYASIFQFIVKDMVIYINDEEGESTNDAWREDEGVAFDRALIVRVDEKNLVLQLNDENKSIVKFRRE